MEPTKAIQPSDDQKESTASKKKSQIQLYLAGAVGGFLICLVDQIGNGENAVIFRIAEALGVWIKSPLITEHGNLLALIFTVLLAVFLCWINEPKTKLDAFARGFAVFAVLNLTPVTPSHGNNAGTDPAPSDTDNIVAYEAVNIVAYEAVSYNRLEQTAFAYPQVRDAKVALRLVSVKDLSETLTLVTVRNPTTARIIYRDYKKSDLVLLDLPQGTYRVELDVPGHRRSKFRITVDARQTNAFRVKLTASEVPLGVQRLYGFQEITADPDPELQREVDKHRI